MEEASTRYQEALKGHDGAVRYLRGRGFTGTSALSFRLGVVAEPLTGHERYAGRLAIPYLTPYGVATIRFRALPDDEGNEPEPKYLSLPGDTPRLYNVGDLFRPEPYLAICEGEVDTMTAHDAGVPSVGAAGVSAWREFFARCVEGYERIYVLADNDDRGQGQGFAYRVAEQVRQAVVVAMPDGHDVNSFTRECGAEALRARLGV